MRAHIDVGMEIVSSADNEHRETTASTKTKLLRTAIGNTLKGCEFGSNIGGVIERSPARRIGCGQRLQCQPVPSAPIETANGLISTVA